MARAKLYFEDVKEGDELRPFTVENLTRGDFVKYAGASGDFTPLHYDLGVRGGDGWLYDLDLATLL